MLQNLHFNLETSVTESSLSHTTETSLFIGSVVWQVPALRHHSHVYTKLLLTTLSLINTYTAFPTKTVVVAA